MGKDFWMMEMKSFLCCLIRWKEDSPMPKISQAHGAQKRSVQGFPQRSGNDLAHTRDCFNVDIYRLQTRKCRNRTVRAGNLSGD